MFGLLLPGEVEVQIPRLGLAGPSLHCFVVSDWGVHSAPQPLLKPAGGNGVGAAWNLLAAFVSVGVQLPYAFCLHQSGDS